MGSPSISFAWNNLTHLGIRQDVEKYVDGPFKCMGKLLLPSGLYLNELKIFKSVSLKLALRLRSSPVTVVSARLLHSLSSFVELQIIDYLTSHLDSLFNERIDTRSGKILLPSPDIVINCLHQLQLASSYLKCSIEYCLYAFGLSMMWLHLGHMNQHFLTVLASLSRLSILSKSFLVYSCDLYKGLYLILDKLQRNLFHLKLPVKDTLPSIDHFLLQLNLIPSQGPFASSARDSGRGETVNETVEEPFLVERRIEPHRDLPPSSGDPEENQNETISTVDCVNLTVGKELKSLSKKRKSTMKRLASSSTKMKRIFNTFKRSKMRTPNKKNKKSPA